MVHIMRRRHRETDNPRSVEFGEVENPVGEDE